MAWPTSKPNSTAFDSADDSISTSRAELKTMSDAVNNIVDFVDTTGISNGDVLVYDSATDTIKPGSVTSPFTQGSDSAGDTVQATTNKMVLRPNYYDSAGAEGGDFVVESRLVGISENNTGWRIGINDANPAFSRPPTMDFVFDETGSTSEIQFFNNFTGLQINRITATQYQVPNLVCDQITTDDVVATSGSDIQISSGSSQDVRLWPGTGGAVDFKVSTQTTIGANGSASALTANPVGYINIEVNGVAYIMPYYNI